MKGERRVLSTQLASNLAAMLNNVAYGGKFIVVTRHSTPMAALISIDDYEHFRQLLRDEEKRAAEVEASDAGR
jgi:prevent-host-death family protein